MPNFRKFITIAAVVSLSLANLSTSSAQNYGARQNTSPNRAYFPVNNCLNMGNGLEAPNEGEWGYRFERGDFALIRERGFDTVRIPIKWSAHIEAGAPYRIDPTFLRHVDDIVSWGLAARLNVIINVHHFDELYTNPNANERKLLAIWEQLAAHYQDALQSLMFEIINEPREALSGARANSVQARALASIRRTNPNRTVILAGDNWGGIDGMENLQLPNDPFVIPTVHYYGPFEFTHQGAEWLPNAPPAGRNWPQQGDIAQLNNDIDRIVAWQNRMNAPVFIGEYGTDIAVPINLRERWARDVTTGLKRAGFATCYYNFAGGFPIYDKSTRRWQEGILRALGLR